jgi:hypothetical protein
MGKRFAAETQRQGPDGRGTRCHVLWFHPVSGSAPLGGTTLRARDDPAIV